MAFNVDKAREAGYSDGEIAEYLSKESSFKIEDARSAGYDDSEIVGHLVGIQTENESFKHRASDVIKSGITKATELGKEAGAGVLRKVIGAGQFGLDRANDLVQGAIAVPEAAVGLADIPTGGRAGKALEEVGFNPKDAKAILSENYSAEQKAANQAVQDADGFVDTAVAAVKNPLSIASTVTQSAPLMLAGGAAGMAARGIGASPVIAGAIGEGVVGAGSAAEGTRQQTKDGLLTAKQSALSLASGLGTTLAGSMGGKLAQKLGIADIDTVLAGGSTEMVKQSLAKRLTFGGLSEGVFEEMPQSVQEQVLANMALDKPLMDGVDQAAAMGLLSGGAMGAGASAAITNNSKNSNSGKDVLIVGNEAMAADDAMAAQQQIEYEQAQKSERIKAFPDENLNRLRKTASILSPTEVPIIDAEIQRRANTPTLQRAAEAFERIQAQQANESIEASELLGNPSPDNSLLDQVNQFTEALPASDILEDIDNGNLSDNAPTTMVDGSGEKSSLDDSVFFKGLPNATSSDPKDFINIVNSDSFGKQGFRGLNVEAQRVVLDSVLRTTENLKILNAIIPSIPIDVMDVLASQNITPQMLFHDKSMLAGLLARNGINGTKVSGDSVDALVRAIASFTAKPFSASGSDKGFTTTNTSGKVSNSSSLDPENVFTSSAAENINTSDVSNTPVKTNSTISAVDSSLVSPVENDLTGRATKQIFSSSNPRSIGTETFTTSGTIDDRHDVTPNSDVGLGDEAATTASSPSILPSKSNSATKEKLAAQKRTKTTANQLFEKNREAIEALAPRMNWGTIGNKRIDDAQGNQIGRTKFVPIDDAMEEIRKQGTLSYNGMREAVAKALKGAPLSKAEQRTIDLIADYAEANPSVANPIDAEQMARIQAEYDAEPAGTFDELVYGVDTPEAKVAVTELSDDALDFGLGKEVSSDEFETWLNAEGTDNEQKTGTERIETQTGSDGASRETGTDRENPQGNSADGNQQQSTPVKTQENNQVRPLVEAIVKRRAAAAQIGKEDEFDTALKLAKDYMAGKQVAGSKFKAAANLFKQPKDAPDERTLTGKEKLLVDYDQPLSDLFSSLAEMASPSKEVEKSTRKAVGNAIEAYKTLIANAKTASELQAIARDIQAEESLSDAKAQELDDLVFDAIDALENSNINDTTEKSVDETENNRQDKLTINEGKVDNNTGPESAINGTKNSEEPSTGKDSALAQTSDLLGDNTAAKQAVADAERAKDTKRNTGKNNQDTFTLTGSNQEADIAAANGAQDLFATPTKETALASIKAADDITKSEKIKLAADLRKGDITPADVSAIVGTETTKPAESKQAIEDFGEKLEGARKDMVRAMSKEYSDDEIASLPLSKLWPLSDIDLIENKMAAAIAYVAREIVPSKPRKSYKVAWWVEKVKAGREIGKIFSDALDKDEASVIEKFNKLKLGSLQDKVALLTAIERDQWKRIGIASTYPNAYTYRDGVKTPKPYTVIVIDGNAVNFDGVTNIADTVEKVNSLLSGKSEEKRLAFEVRGRNGKFFIMKKGDKEFTKLKTFNDDDAKAAFAFIKNNYDELVIAWEATKDRLNVKESDVRYKSNRPRTGEDYRKGKDVTTEQFASTFGFRGVQFGEWVKQGGKDNDRQGALNAAYDALMDLSKIVDVPPKAMSLEGTLGLSFGARGKGSAAAHFEPGNLVINLTKTQGAGTLAHEWFHALDNYFSRKRGGEKKMSEVKTQQGYRESNYITYKPEPLFVHAKFGGKGMTKAELKRRTDLNPESKYFDADSWVKDSKHPEGVRPQVEERFSDLVETLNTSPMKARALSVDKGKENGYWSSIIEMGARTFENYVIHKMQLNGYDNDYLANVVRLDNFNRDSSRFPYLLDEELAPVSEAFDNLFGEIKTKETDDGNVALFSRSTANNLADQLQAIIDGDNPARGNVLTIAENSPASLQMFGFDNLPVVTRTGEDGVLKMHYEHGLSVSKLASVIENGLKRPAMILQYKGQAGIESLRFVTNETKNGNPIILAIQPERQTSTSNVQLVATAFEVNAETIARDIKNGNLLYRDTNAAMPDSIRNAVKDAQIKYAREPRSLLGVIPNSAPSRRQAYKVLSQSDIVKFEGANSDNYYSRGTGTAMPQQQVQAIVDNIKAKWKNSPPIFVVDSMQDDAIPKHVREYDMQLKSNGATGDPIGFISNGKVFILSTMVKNTKAVHEVLFHEALGHYGLRGVYGSGLEKILDQIVMLRKKDVIAKAKNYGLVIKSKADLRRAAEEVLAEMAQTKPDIGLVKRAIAAIRQFLRDIGLDIELSDNDIIANYLIPARNYVINGGKEQSIPSGVEAAYARSESAPIFYSQLSRAFENAKQSSMPAQQWKLWLQSNAAQLGVKADEIQWSGINEFLDLQTGKVTKQAIVDYLDANGVQVDDDVLKKVGGGKVENVVMTREVKPNIHRLDEPRMTKFDRVVETSQQGFTITPAMRDKVSVGLPMFSRSAPQQQQAPDETKGQKFQRMQQDKFNRFKVLQNWLKDNGTDISEDADVYLAETVMSSRVAARKLDFREDFVQPLIEKTQDAGITMQQVGDFLKIQHAPEANKRSREIHGRGDATAYGVTDAEASSKMAEFKQLPNYEALNKIANEWQSITDKTKKIKLDSGLLPEDMVKAWEETYSVYVPVKGYDIKQGTGQGLNVNGKTKQRLGHELRDEAIIENILRDHEAAIVLDEKNLVGKSLIRFAMQVNNDEIITIDKPKKRQVLQKGESAYMVNYFGSDIASFTTKQEADSYVKTLTSEGRDKDGFSVDKTTDAMRVMLQASPMLADNEVNVYVKGHAIRVQINDEIAAKAYKNMGVENLNAILSASREVNNWLSKVYTGYSPDFIFTNPVRDAIQGSITLTARHGAGMAAKIFAHYPNAVKELIKHFKTKGSSQLINRYRNNGGQTGAAYMSDLERIGDDIQASYNEYQGALKTYKNTYDKAIAEGKSTSSARLNAALRSGIAGFQKVPIAGHFLRLMERINSVTENALRVATFDALTQNGVSEVKAAAEAKELMNFNRKGEQSNVMGSLYLFYNPSVQGTKLIHEALFDSPHKNQARALAGMMTLSAITLSALAMSGDDEDKDQWNKTPDYIKDSNIVLDMGDRQITITLPYGYKLFWTLGNVIADGVNGKNIDKLSIRLASSVFENLSPMGNPVNSENGLFQLLPTTPKMALSPSVNENSFGNPVYPRKYKEALPDSQLMNRGTHGSLYDNIAENLNALSGGSEYKKGYADVSPETLKYWVQSLTGGTGKFVFDAIGITKNAVQGVAPQDVKDIPVIRRFVRETGVSDARQAFYDRKNEADAAAGQFSLAKTAHDRDAMMELRQKDGKLIRLAKVSDRFRKMANSKRELMVKIKNDDSLSLKEKLIKMRDIEKQETQIYDKFIQKFDSSVK